MSKLLLARSNGVYLAILAAGTLVAGTPRSDVIGAKPSPEAARLERFAHPDGTNYFALSLRPPRAPTPAAAQNIVVLFDTSASQTGKYRADAVRAFDDGWRAAHELTALAAAA